MFKGQTWLVMLWGYVFLSAVPPVDNLLRPVANTFSNTISNFAKSAFSNVVRLSQNAANNEVNNSNNSNTTNVSTNPAPNPNVNNEKIIIYRYPNNDYPKAYDPNYYNDNVVISSPNY